jgi:hypothetical protein
MKINDVGGGKHYRYDVDNFAAADSRRRPPITPIKPITFFISSKELHIIIIA